MPKRDMERLFQAVEEVADRLAEDEESITSVQFATDLRQSGVDPELLKHRVHQVLKEVARRERLVGRSVPLAMRQAIEKLSPDDVMPSDEQEAESKMGRWLERFSESFAVPRNLETARAYRKTGEVSAEEKADLDELEQQLKDDIGAQDDAKG